MNEILNTKLNDADNGFALLYRPQSTGKDSLDFITGPVSYLDSIEDIPVPDVGTVNHSSEYYSFVAMPYNQLKERGFAYRQDDAQLIHISVTSHELLPLSDIKPKHPGPITFSNNRFTMGDDEYAEIVEKIIEREIGNGEGSNFVIKRQFVANLTEYTIGTAFSIFCNLLEKEIGAYWTFLVHTGNRTFIGASPELHIGLRNRIAMMNPISGTYRYPKSGPTLDGVMKFVSSVKEKDELYMVVEEELKMASRIFPLGGTVRGPFLRQMSRLAHTEFHIEGMTDCDPRVILRETMFSPAVTGSPLENACRIIKKYEPQGRGYYSGVGALIGMDSSGHHSVDSAILIRTADIDHNGGVKIGVGATIVRHSNPIAETAETQVKAEALLAAMGIRTKDVRQSSRRSTSFKCTEQNIS